MTTSDDGDEAAKSGRRDAPGETDRPLADVKADLGALVAEHPVGVLATALGVGYVLGGGVFTRLTSRLLRLGLRLGIQFAVMPVLEQELATIVGLGRTTNGTGDDPPEGSPTHH
jgi:hypothetical protein